MNGAPKPRTGSLVHDRPCPLPSIPVHSGPCLSATHNPAMKFYLVGGAVRDRLLGLPFKERDWLVVGGTPEQLLALGFRRADADFPVFLHPATGEEYALARTETKNGPGYKGFAVDAGPQVTLEQDLARRDLTINALAEDENGNIIDPFGGREDLDNGLLRHITPAFVEDPVRVVRVARFAAKLGRWGFRVAHGTHALMTRMTADADFVHLKTERLWRELGQALAEPQPWRFFEVLQRCGAWRVLLPGLVDALGASPGHGAEPAPAILALQRAAAATEAPRIRFAAFFGALPEAATLAGQLRPPKEFLELTGLLARHGEAFRAAAAGDAAGIHRLLKDLRAQQRPERLADFLQGAAVLWPQAAATAVSNLRLAADALQGLSAEALQRQGLHGPALGEALHRQALAAIAAALNHSPANF
jgi:tRNA nucleotidyltransferase (CCA-adding enzyme)